MLYIFYLQEYLLKRKLCPTKEQPTVFQFRVLELKKNQKTNKYTNKN